MVFENDYEKLKKTIYGENYNNVKEGKPFVHVAKSKSTGKILIQVGDEMGEVSSKILTIREAFKLAYRLLDMVYDKIRSNEK